MAAMTPDSVAFLRGINVGGHHRVAMADLRNLFAELGYPGAATLVQSGNVLFESGTTDFALIGAELERGFEARFGFAAPFVLRRAGEMSEVVSRNPFHEGVQNPAWLHVVFLANAPAPEIVAGLDPAQSPPDEFVVDGRHVYVHYPNGSGRSRLKLDLGTVATARNWNTVTKVLALMRPTVWGRRNARGASTTGGGSAG
jgi:uncharacterized protein (DUF1697 family)